MSPNPKFHPSYDHAVARLAKTKCLKRGGRAPLSPPPFPTPLIYDQTFGPKLSNGNGIVAKFSCFFRPSKKGSRPSDNCNVQCINITSKGIVIIHSLPCKNHYSKKQAYLSSFYDQSHQAMHFFCQSASSKPQVSNSFDKRWQCMQHLLQQDHIFFSKDRARVSCFISSIPANPNILQYF